VPRLVALDLPWGERFVHALTGIWEAGDAACPLDPRLPAPAAKELVAALRPTHVLGPDERAEPLRGGLPAEPGDALVVATSGSGGPPKGVVLTHQAVAASAAATSDRLGVDPARDRWLACIPLSHVGGLGVVTRALLTGTPLVVHERFEADALQASAQGPAPVTLVSLVPTALRRVDPALFRIVLLGGAPPSGRLASNVVTTFGMTETCGGVVYDGLPLEGVEMAIAGEDGAGGGDLGEILLRGPMLLREYRDGKDPKLDSGWLPTGDAGRIDDQGRLRVAGRIAETINTGGEKVWPGSVEPLISALVGVAEVAVVGRPDPEWGERVVAFVVPADPAVPPETQAIREAVSSVLAPWAAPREIVFVRALPRTPSGKIARRLLA
jgi:o-succinylbenzoate---CoA ligase